MTTPMIKLPLSEKSELDILAILRTLKLVVAEAGDDFVYEPVRVSPMTSRCLYVIEDVQGNKKPDCIGGQVLHRLGVPLDLLVLWEGKPVDCMAYEAYRRPIVGFSKESLEVLRAAQQLQDQSRPWGDCRDRALLFAYEKYGVTAA